LRERTRQRVIYARSEVRLIRELAAMGEFGAKAPGHCTKALAGRPQTFWRPEVEVGE